MVKPAGSHLIYIHNGLDTLANMAIIRKNNKGVIPWLGTTEFNSIMGRIG
jgi:hypothetical protein